jgi:hypothetical protein
LLKGQGQGYNMRCPRGRVNYKSLIFLHIPKAAGTTLDQIIERQYSQVHIFNIDGGNVHSSIEEFKNLSELQRESIVCLKGAYVFWFARVFASTLCLHYTSSKPA